MKPCAGSQQWESSPTHFDENFKDFLYVKQVYSTIYVKWGTKLNSYCNTELCVHFQDGSARLEMLNMVH